MLRLARAAVRASATIDLAAMRYSDHQNDQLALLDFIHYPVVANANASQAPQLALERGADKGVPGQRVDCRDDLVALWASYAKQFLACASLNPSSSSRTCSQSSTGSFGSRKRSMAVDRSLKSSR